MAGAPPETIDVVILSHADFDHIGGAVDESGNPTFSNARYAHHSVQRMAGTLNVFGAGSELWHAASRQSVSGPFSPQPPVPRQPRWGRPPAVGRTLSCLLGKNKARPTKLCGSSFNDTFPEGLSKIVNSLQLFFLRRKRRVTFLLLPQARRSWEVCRPFFRPLHDLLATASFSHISELPLHC